MNRHAMNRTERGLLVAAIVLAIFGGVLSFFSGTAFHAASPDASFRSRDPRGLKALRLFLEESDLGGEMIRSGFKDLPEGRGNLLVVSPPSQLGIGGDEAKALFGWVARGNTLLYLGREGEEVPPHTKRNEIPSVFGLPRGPARDTSAEALWNDILRAREDHASVVEARGTLLPGGGAVSLVPIRQTPTPEGWESLLVREPAGAGLVFTRAIGGGRAVYLPTSSVFENRLIRRERNPEILLAILIEAAPPKTRILFDEYHHGLAARARAVSIFQSDETRWFLGQALLAGLLLVLSGGTRGAFGAPARAPQPPHLLDGVAHLYAERLPEADAARDLAEALRRSFRRRTGIDPFLDPAAARARLIGRGLCAAAAREAVEALAHPSRLARVDAAAGALENPNRS